MRERVADVRVMSDKMEENEGLQQENSRMYNVMDVRRELIEALEAWAREAVKAADTWRRHFEFSGEDVSLPQITAGDAIERTKAALAKVRELGMGDDN